jgi:hypothetical protein
MQVRSAAAVTGALSVVLLLAGGCATSSARVITVVTPKVRTAAPAVKNTGTAWPAILASLAAYGQWSLANPDPATVAAVAVPGCSTANQLAEQMTGLLGSRALVKPSLAITLNRGSDRKWRFCSIESIVDGSPEDPTVALL